MLVVDNEVDPAYGYLPAALREMLPAHDLVRPREGDDFPEPAATGDLEAVVLTGSTAGIYEADDYPWMAEERAFVRRLVDAGVPTIGVCFGHQIVNDALGGRVEPRDFTAELVGVDFDDDPLFAGVHDTVPMVHGDHVVAAGEGMAPVARADYYPLLATRHAEAPVWTVQYHPEFDAALLPRVREDFGWTPSSRSFADVTVGRTVRNFLDAVGVTGEAGD